MPERKFYAAPAWKKILLAGLLQFFVFALFVNFIKNCMLVYY